MNMAVDADFRSNEEIMKIYEKLKSPGLYSTQTYLVAFGVLCIRKIRKVLNLHLSYLLLFKCNKCKLRGRPYFFCT
jgi:hypothetical protein